MRRSKRPPVAKIASGSFASVIRAYMSSPVYKALQPSTRYVYSRALALAEQPETLGVIPVDMIRPALVQAFLDGLADRPGQQKNARTAIKAVEAWALVRDMIPFPITTGTICITSDGGHEPWTDAQVELAERHAGRGLDRVITLAVHTGQRGSDIVKMRWSDIEEQDGHTGINVVQKKTGRRLWIPFTDELTAKMATWEKKPPFFLVLKPDGQPYTRPQLSWNWNEERDTNENLEPLKEAGLVLHGLRATAVVRARRRGAKVLQISDMFGMSEPMVARYSRLADQRENALAAVHYLNGTRGERSPQTEKKMGS